MIRVLVVDDVETVRHAVRLILSLEADIAVVADAANGLAGLRLARELRPDVIVLDLHMPGMDGFAVLRELATRLPETRVVVLSGDVGFRTTAFAFGASAFVAKGSAVAELPGAVHAAFAERHVPALPFLGAPQHAV
jgi:DNA-binding NarL/FixJ family response regulator